MELKERVSDLVDECLPEIFCALGAESIDPGALGYSVDLPKVSTHGDFAVNLAFILAKRARKNPYEVASICGNILDQKRKDDSRHNWLDEIRVEKPGFINFKLTRLAAAAQIIPICGQDESYGHSNFGKGARVLIEFVSANPTGPLTIAHGRQAAIGDTLARILKATGFIPHKEFYLNDRGRQVRLLGESLLARYLEQFGISCALPEEGYQGAYLVDLAKRLAGETGDRWTKKERKEAVAFMTQYAVKAMLLEIEDDLRLLGVSFDEFFSEASLTVKGEIERVFADLVEKGVTFEADGALWLRSSAYGDDKDRVLKKSDGELTYLAPDIAYHRTKFERGFELLVNLWGPDHHGYVARVRAACEALGYSPAKLKILIVQLTTLFRKGIPLRMSTRKGEFVTLKELVNEVGESAARFFFLMRKVESHLDFDLELAKQKTDENPVYYVQYAHARISSILKFSNTQVSRDANLNLIQSDEELELAKKLAEYPEVLIQAAQRLEPYRVVDYLREVAAFFHKFYAKHRVVSEDVKLTEARLLLVDCVRIVIRNGLGVIGVDAPELM